MLDSMHITVDGSRNLVDPAMKKWAGREGDRLPRMELGAGLTPPRI